VGGVVDSTVSSAQAAAFLMASCIHGMEASETAALTRAMAQSGVMFRKNVHGLPQVDKHSTGGVGDKVSLLLAPLARACGLAVPMISGRGLGHTGGTVDKLESVVGFNTMLDHQQMQNLLDDHNLFMAGQSASIAPADRILYSLRDVTGTVENIGLITASILSKKFAEGLDGLVMDVKVGRAAFMQTLIDAQQLARSMMDVSTAAGLPMTVVFSRMDSPLGRSVGNWLEMKESEEALKYPDRAARDLVEVTTELAVRMVMLGDAMLDHAAAQARVQQAWRDGSAHEEFMNMIERQGGQWDASVQKYAAVPTMNVVADGGGRVIDIDAMKVAHAVMQAGGGRLVETDELDHSSGVEFHATVGDRVESGDIIAVVTAMEEDDRTVLTAAIKDAVHIGTAPVEPEPSMIIDVWVS